MYLGRVIGTCVASQKTEGLSGVKLLVVQPLDERAVPKGRVQVAVDVVRAGTGDFVYLVGAREAAHALEESFVPVDAAVVGIVDDLHVPAVQNGGLPNGGGARS
jgi:ethanolamine utilization protein EutN